MATIFSHAVVGCTIVSTFSDKMRTKTIYVLAAGTAVLPDIDYFGFINRIPYDSLWGHRGLTHSVVFALLTGMTVSFLFKLITRSQSGHFPLFFVTTLSHGLIDACTNGGLGVAFYSPYNRMRYFFPWRPIQVSPMGLGIFSERGLVVLMSELFWILIPCFLLMSVLGFFRRAKF